MQSSQLEKAKVARDSYQTEHEREAFAAGYDHAHGIACHNVPTIGETYFLESEGYITPETQDEAREAHIAMCFEAELNARCYTPWEFVAKEINDLDEFESEAAWEAYESGVELAILHDVEDCEYEREE